MLDKFVPELVKDLNMAEVGKNEETGQFVLSFANDVEVNVFQTEDGVYKFKGVVKNCPKEKTEDFLVRVMEGNLFGKATMGSSVLGLDNEGKILTLSLDVDYNITFREWKEKLEDFVNVIDYWRQEVMNHK